MKQTALVVGRFQPFHLGHLKLIQKVARKRDIGKIIIAIGSSQFKNTLENPFSAEERKEMIKKSLQLLLPYEIIEIPDINDNEKWVYHLANITGKFDLVYANSQLEKRLFRDVGYPVRSTEFFQREQYSGTEIRRRILSREEWKELVPKGTLEVMEKIKGEERIRNLTSD